MAAATSKVRALKGLSLKESVSQFSSTMTAQADLRVECAHLRRFYNNFASVSQSVTPPYPFPGCETAEVLIETFEPGQSHALQFRLSNWLLRFLGILVSWSIVRMFCDCYQYDNRCFLLLYDINGCLPQALKAAPFWPRTSRTLCFLFKLFQSINAVLIFVVTIIVCIILSHTALRRVWPAQHELESTIVLLAMAFPA